MLFGIMYQAMPGDNDKMSLQVFSGPVITRTQTSQTFVATSGGMIDDDFDMKLDNFQFGLHAGAQVGYNLGKYFKINPYLLTAIPFGDSCAKYDVTIRKESPTDPLSSQSDIDCGGTEDGSTPSRARHVQIGLQGLEFSGGINLIYKPWGLTVNLTAPFLKKLDTESTDIFLLTFSLPFGNYPK